MSLNAHKFMRLHMGQSFEEWTMNLFLEYFVPYIRRLVLTYLKKR